MYMCACIHMPQNIYQAISFGHVQNGSVHCGASDLPAFIDNNRRSVEDHDRHNFLTALPTSIPASIIFSNTCLKDTLFCMLYGYMRLFNFIWVIVLIVSRTLLSMLTQQKTVNFFFFNTCRRHSAPFSHCLILPWSRVFFYSVVV